MHALRCWHVQERRGLRCLYPMPGAHVFWCCGLEHKPDVYGLSSERHFGGWQSVGGVLLLRGGVRAGERHRLVRAVQSG